MRKSRQNVVVVYMITHVATKRSYIGITTQKPTMRWRQHCWDAMDAKRCKSALHRAISKYGAHAFNFEILRKCDAVESARLAERELIAERNTMRPNGFNLTGGGEMMIGVVHSDEMRKALSEAMKLRWKKNGCPFRPRSSAERSAATKAYYAEHPKQPESDETIHRKSKAASVYWDRRRADFAAGLIGRVGHAPSPDNHSDDMRRKVAESVRLSWLTRERSFPDAAKEKISASLKAAYRSGRRQSHKGQKRTPDQCARIAIAAKWKPGRKAAPCSKEAREKLSASVRAAWARRKMLLSEPAGSA